MEKSSWYNRKRASIVSHMKWVRHIGCSSEAASGNVVKFTIMRESQSSRSVKSSQLEKSSWYNRNRASIVSHMKWVCHIGCSSKAASGNMVKFHRVLHSNQWIFFCQNMDWKAFVGPKCTSKYNLIHSQIQILSSN